MAPCDLVVVEGFKTGAHLKIETARVANADGLLADQDAMISAVACTDPGLAASHLRLDLDDIATIADFIAERVDLKR